jgi:tetratricopeptide (TPR) repeat protein
VAITIVVVAIAALLLAREPLRHAYCSYQFSRRRDAFFETAAKLHARPIAFRFRGETVFRPLREPTRGNNVPTSRTEWQLRAAASAVQLAAAGDLSSEAVRARAAADVYLGRIDDAIHALEYEQTASPKDPLLLSDLSAAYDARAVGRSSALALVSALATAARAHELAPRMPEAAWNYASAIEAIGLATESRAAWRAYLDLDSTSSWADEARRHLAAARGATDEESWNSLRRDLDSAAEGGGDVATIANIAFRFPLRTATLVQQEWIPRWTGAAMRRDPHADAILRNIQVAASAVARATSDFLLADFVSAAHRQADFPAFVAAHARMPHVRETLRQRGTDEAERELEGVRAELQRVNSPMVAVAACDLASLYYHAGSYDRALQQLDAAPVDAQRYPLLAARATWDRGVTLASRGLVPEARAAYRRALDLYRRTGDQTRSSMLQLLLGDIDELTLNLDETWERYLDAIRQVERHGEIERDLVILDACANVALRQQRLALASMLSEAVIARAVRPGDQPFVCHARITDCGASERLFDHVHAVEQCRAARTAFASIPDRAVRDRLEADLEIAEADVAPQRSRATTLGRAVDICEARHDVYRLSRVLLLRARAYLANGALQLARADLERALVAVEEQRLKLETVGDKISFFETSRAIVDELVHILIDASEIDAALQLTDRVRARALLERITGSGAPPLMSIADLRRSLDADTALLVEWSEATELYTWIVRREGVKFRRRSVHRNVLADNVQQFANAIAAPNPTPIGPLQRAATRLAADLLPAEDLGGIYQLIVIPDEPLARLPFAALRPGGRAYLIEQYAIAQSPSLAAYVATRGNEARQSVLLLANPATGGSLPRLDVRREIAHAVHAIRRAEIIEGADAKRSALRAGAPRADVVHIAAHGFADSPAGGPAIALTPERNGDNGLLSASEISSMSLRRGSLVVLAACRGGSGRTSLEGTMSLAHAFTTAGAHSVIASLSDTEDDDSGHLFSAFYPALAAGATPASALRSAQRSMLVDPAFAHPRHWAAYQLYGGN